MIYIFDINGNNCNLELAEKLGKKNISGPKWARIGRDGTRSRRSVLKFDEEVVSRRPFGPKSPEKWKSENTENVFSPNVCRFLADVSAFWSFIFHPPVLGTER